jgi:exodeoxyribonuclease V alpha subunit
MPSKLTELTLIFRRERIRFDGSDTCILECEEPKEDCEPKQREFADPCGGLNALLAVPSCVIVKADVPDTDPLVGGLSYRFYGRWIEHERHGRQFQAKTFVRVQPHGKAGVIRYLTITCAGHGVGHATALRLWDKFGGDAVRILREEPEVAVAAAGMPHFTDEKATAASAVLKEESALEAVHIDLIDLLGGRGFPRETAKKAIGEWGNRVAVLLKKNAYLLRLFYPGRFLQTDRLFLDSGGNPKRLKRQAMAAWYSLAHDNDGHTWFRPEQCETGIRRWISGADNPEIKPVSAMILAKRAKLLTVLRNGDGNPWVAESRKADNERTVAEHVRTMLATPVQWPEITGLDISEHQASELAKALRSSLALFGGSPGTGKTYTAARLIGRIIDLCGSDQVAVAAPTGKAAVRISEALEGYGVKKQATTIHRLLGVASRSAGEGWGFQHDESNPLEQKYFVLDESSMVDTDLFASLLRALPSGAHLLLVGDVNQLPPVGHGAPLRDMIAAGVPAGELTKIERNWGTIVQACADIRDGKKWQTVNELEPDAGLNLKLIPAANGSAAVEKIVSTILKIRNAKLYDPIWGVQVIVAVNKKSELSRRDLNKRLQGELNPAGQRAGSNPFRVGDKIVCLKNSLVPICDDAPPEYNRDALDSKVFVANGEQARVVSVSDKLTTVSLDSPKRLVKIPRGADNGNDQGEKNASNGEHEDAAASTDTGCQWDLAYAISCHKSQGSEWPCVIVALDEYPGARRICSREWIYTAISRAKSVCLLVGKRNVADGMCVTRSITKRKTFLKELILGTVK